MALPLFDQLMKEGNQTEAARVFAKEYYDNGKMGYTRKLLIEELAKRVEILEARNKRISKTALEQIEVVQQRNVRLEKEIEKLKDDKRKLQQEIDLLIENREPFRDF